MRIESIDICVSMRVPINCDGTGVCKIPCFKDANGVVYEETAIKDACEEANGSNLPIIRYNDSGDPVVIGVAKSVRYQNGYIDIEGSLFAGGTSEEIIFTSTKDVCEMTIESIGLGT